jgi:hypothetical protein
MRFRKLRIAWSVVWGLLAVLLIVLWVRSYWWTDLINLTVVSTEGNLYVYSDISLTAEISSKWEGMPRYERWWGHSFPAGLVTMGGIAFFGVPFIPYWTLVLASAATATITLLPNRFSLRTLLIATTLIAVALAVIVYGLR